MKCSKMFLKLFSMHYFLWLFSQIKIFYENNIISIEVGKLLQQLFFKFYNLR
jgi:hypothetical protein